MTFFAIVTQSRMLGHVGGRGGSLNVVITALLSFSLQPKPPSASSRQLRICTKWLIIMENDCSMVF